MANVSFIRGKIASYDLTTMTDSIYFATDTNTIYVNGKAYGIYPKDLRFLVDGDEVEWKTLCRNVNVNLQPYSLKTEIDFSNGEYLQFEIDLSTCSQHHNIELLGIGADISTWGNFGKTLRFFYSNDKSYVGNNNITMSYYKSPSGDEGQLYTEVLSSGKNLTIKLSKQGVFINGTKRGVVTSDVMEGLLALKEVYVGSARTDDTEGRCDATYAKFFRGKTIKGKEAYFAYKANDLDTELKEIPIATQAQCGMFSIEDKKKLDGLDGNIDAGEY